jgi:hypothetical protein
VASKIMSLLRKRGVLLLIVSVAAALIAAKSGGHSPYGMWDGPI